MTSDTVILQYILDEFRAGNPAPLAALISAGSPELMNNDECREVIANAVLSSGKKGKSGISAETKNRNFDLIVSLKILTGFGVTPVEKAISMAAKVFHKSEETLMDIWKKHQDGYFWLEAREAGIALNKNTPNADLSNLKEISESVSKKMRGNEDKLLGLRMAAASGLLKNPSDRKGIIPDK